MNAALIKELFDYKDGVLIRKKCTARRHTLGEAVGWSNGKGYLLVTIRYSNYLVHRIIWAYFNGELPQKNIDHIDGDTTNNRIENLRLVTKSENARNKKIRSDNKSGVQGVYWVSKIKKWEAAIVSGKKTVRLGQYKDFHQAASIRLTAEDHYGYHKNHGRI